MLTLTYSMKTRPGKVSTTVKGSYSIVFFSSFAIMFVFFAGYLTYSSLTSMSSNAGGSSDLGRAKKDDNPNTSVNIRPSQWKNSSKTMASKQLIVNAQSNYSSKTAASFIANNPGVRANLCITGASISTETSEVSVLGSAVKTSTFTLEKKSAKKCKRITISRDVATDTSPRAWDTLYLHGVSNDSQVRNVKLEANTK